jgi:nitrogen-specific signal transduction histidine kinase
MEQKEKELERQIFQTQKDDSISTLAGGVAHDFNNFLMSIVGFCESIENELPKENRAETIGLIKKTAIRAAGVSKQMLVYASNDPNAHTMSEPVDLNKFFDEFSDLLVAIVPKKIKLTTPLRLNTATLVLADEVLLQQVILNLLRNAIDAIGEKAQGEITISCWKPASSFSDEYFVKGKLKNQTDYCEIRILDSGCGIPHDQISRVFDLYYSTKMTGHGIGLAVSSSIIQNHGGLIACKSDEGIGTEIRILLPIATDSEPEQEQQAKSNEMQLADKCILVIDDEPTVLMSIAMMLESRGCKVYQAESGADALEQLPSISTELDCIILDYTMPKMNGLQVLEQFRESEITVPVIMCSGLPMNQIEHDGESWPDDILNKPFQMQELCEKISTLCKSKS